MSRHPRGRAVPQENKIADMTDEELDEYSGKLMDGRIFKGVPGIDSTDK
jgi:hypothetical protein